MEGIRLDEDLVSKTSAGQTVQSSSLWPSATIRLQEAMRIGEQLVLKTSRC